MDRIEILKQAAALMSQIRDSAQKANSGITELIEALAKAQDMPRVTVDVLDALTPRQKEIFFLIASGTQVEEIAKKLSVSPRTVHSHRDMIRNRLNLKNVAELNQFAVAYRTRTP